jgi:acyl carrier protein
MTEDKSVKCPSVDMPTNEVSEISKLTYATVIDAIKRGVRSVKGEVIETENIRDSTTLWDAEVDEVCLEFDSLDLVEFVVFLESEFGWVISNEQLDTENWRTVGDLAAVIMATAPGSSPTLAAPNAPRSGSMSYIDGQKT